MPRSDRSFGRMRERSRERILASALELFASRGYAQTSVRMIARRAGVSQGLMYNYFEGKRGLLRAIFERSMEDVGETFAAAQAAEPVESLAVLIRAAFESVRANSAFWKLSYQVRMQPDVLADVGDDVVASGELIRARIEALLERTGVRHASAHSRLLFAAIDGAAQHWALDRERYPLDVVADEMIRLLVPSPDKEREGA